MTSVKKGAALSPRAVSPRVGSPISRGHADAQPNSTVWDKEQMIEGTLEALMDWVIEEPNSHASNLRNLFFLSYRSICTTEELFNLLFQKFFRAEPLSLVQLKVISFIRNWIDKYFDELRIEKDSPLLNMIEDFFKRAETESPELKKSNRHTLSRLKQKLEESSFVLSTADLTSHFIHLGTIHEFDALDIAKELTIIDFKLFARVQPFEFIHMAQGKEYLAPNAKKLTKWFDSTTMLFKSLIVRESNVKVQQKVLIKVLEIIQHLFTLNNLNSMLSLNVALSSVLVSKLKILWDSVKSVGKLKQNFEKINKLCSPDGNFKKLRKVVESNPGPIVPYLGMYFQELIYADEQNPKMTENGLFNCNRIRKIGRILQIMKTCQDLPYEEINNKKHTAIREFLIYTPRFNDDLYYNYTKIKETGSLRKPRPMMNAEEKSLEKMRILMIGLKNTGKTTISRVLNPLHATDHDPLSHVQQFTAENIKAFLNIIKQDPKLTLEDSDLVSLPDKQSYFLLEEMSGTRVRQKSNGGSSEGQVRRLQKEDKHKPTLFIPPAIVSTSSAPSDSLLATRRVSPLNSPTKFSSEDDIKLYRGPQKSNSTEKNKKLVKAKRRNGKEEEEKPKSTEKLPSTDTETDEEKKEGTPSSSRKKPDAARAMVDQYEYVLKKRKEQHESLMHQINAKYFEDLAAIKADFVESLKQLPESEKKMELLRHYGHNDFIVTSLRREVSPSRIRYDKQTPDSEPRKGGRRSSGVRMRITKSFNRDDSPNASPSKSESLIASAEQLPKAPHTGTKAPKLVKIKTWEEKKNFESPRKLKSRSFSESKDDCVNKKKVKDHYFLIIDAILSSQQFDHNIAKKFHYLWSSRFMQRVFRKHQFDLPSQCQYHFPKALEYFSPGYKIDYDDLLNTYLPTTTSPKHDDIELDKERFLLIDTPGASPPLSGAPWQSYWDPSLTIDAIVFVISLGEYLNPLATDPPMTHLQASLDLWKVISSEPQLANIPFILVLNKSDVFEMKKLKNQEYRSVGPENEDKDYSLMKIIESFKDCFGACTMTEFITCTLKKSEIFSVFSTIIKIH